MTVFRERSTTILLLFFSHFLLSFLLNLHRQFIHILPHHHRYTFRPVHSQVKHHDAQVEWNKIKGNEELVREKIEEYLEIFNRLGAPENQGLARPPSPVTHERKDSRGRPRSNTKNDDESADKENDDENEKKDQEWNELDDLNENDDDDDDDDDEDGEKKKKKKKKSYYVKKRKTTDDDIIEDPSQIASQQMGGPLEPLSKKLRQPAQERAYKELSAINERIASLVQVRQMGLATPENKKQLKQLMKDRKKKAYELKRLQSKQRASNKYRNKQKKIVTKKSFFSF